MNVTVQLSEVTLGKGDYSAGGACSEPFLEQDGARRRRPMVLGEVSADPERCCPLTAEMFSGRAADPLEWAAMWGDIGADGICVRADGVPPSDVAKLVTEMSDRTRLPIAVDGSDECLGLCAESVSDSTLILIGDGQSCDLGAHAVAVPIDSLEDCGGAAPGRANRMFLIRGTFTDADRSSLAEEIRRRALRGSEDFDAPIVFDVTPSWDAGFADARVASMVEAESCLVAMLSGADVLIVRGPGAADMARVYGEELADL